MVLYESSKLKKSVTFSLTAVIYGCKLMPSSFRYILEGGTCMPTEVHVISKFLIHSSGVHINMLMNWLQELPPFLYRCRTKILPLNNLCEFNLLNKRLFSMVSKLCAHLFLSVFCLPTKKCTIWNLYTHLYLTGLKEISVWHSVSYSIL